MRTATLMVGLAVTAMLIGCGEAVTGPQRAAPRSAASRFVSPMHSQRRGAGHRLRLVGDRVIDETGAVVFDSADVNRRDLKKWFKLHHDAKQMLIDIDRMLHGNARVGSAPDRRGITSPRLGPAASDVDPSLDCQYDSDVICDPGADAPALTDPNIIPANAGDPCPNIVSHVMSIAQRIQQIKDAIVELATGSESPVATGTYEAMITGYEDQLQDAQADLNTWSSLASAYRCGVVV